ncbi:DUF4517 domain containing protein [Euroglyphus maynei]|uniref:Adipose-secreted signaling protein n=1 Tax=Euroglyphus maynei TaxID=6958 RepID=A0A1Y3AUP7_EURMA|nr:DUF4517 domain containing protein [Euroglyphus maynei]
MSNNSETAQQETRVQFAEENNNLEHNSEIQVQISNELVVNIHLGFLQINHKYEIKFSFESNEMIENKFDLNSSCTNDSHAQIIEIRSKFHDDKSLFEHQLTAHLFAFKEKFLKQTVSLLPMNQTSNKVLTLIFNARVLGKDKGTPLLKNGIQSIGYCPDDDDDDDEEL